MLNFFSFVTVIYLTNGFNIDTTNPIIYKDTQQGSYFGYKVNLYKQKTGIAQLYVGSPKSNIYKKYKYSGAVYRCDIIQPCTTLDFPLDEPRTPEISFWHGFIGGSMDISQGADMLVTGAFHSFEKYGGELPRGYSYLTNLTSGDSILLNPLKDQPHKITKSRPSGDVTLYNAPLAQVGFSIHIPKYSREILQGAPGYLHWSGAVVKIAPNGNIAIGRNPELLYSYCLSGYAISSGAFYNQGELNYVVTAPKKNFGRVEILNFGKSRSTVIEIIQGNQLGEYFGASVATGDINNDQLDDIIIGSPYYYNKEFNEGKISIYLGSDLKKLQKQHENEIIGQHPNGQFGLTIAYLGDINRDSYGDIAVAAPYQDENGVIYIFKGSKYGINTEPSQKIHGKTINPQLKGFGISISKPLDIDDNKFEDLAVGAFQSEHVVILRTRPIVVVTTALETTTPSLKRDTKNFTVKAIYNSRNFYELDTISVVRNITVDEDLGRVAISNYIPNKQIDIHNRYEENITFIIKPTKNYNDPLVVTLTYRLIDKQKSGNVSLIGSKYLIDNNNFCPRCPVLDVDRSSGPERLALPFELDCGSDNLCNSNLTIYVHVVDLRDNNTYILGTKEYLKLIITVSNSGEIAYSTELDIIPNELNFRKIPANCEDSISSKIHCNVDNALGSEKNKTMEVELDLTNINEDNFRDNISIIFNISTTSNNLNPEKTKLVVLNLVREADIFITGYSGEQSYSFGNATMKKPMFTQTYQVEKIGSSPIQKVRIEIQIPYAFKLPDKKVYFLTMYKPEGKQADDILICNSHFSYLVENAENDVEEINELDLDSRNKREVEILFSNSTKQKEEIVETPSDYEMKNSSFSINCSMENVICDNIVCTTNAFQGRVNRAVILFKMVLEETAITDYIGSKEAIIFTTYGSVVIEVPKNFIQTGNKSDNTIVSSLFVGDVSKKIAMWIILIAVVVGLLLLLLLVLILIKAGFFKRSKKDELKKLKARASAEVEDNIISEDMEPMDDVFQEQDLGDMGKTESYTSKPEN